MQHSKSNRAHSKDSSVFSFDGKSDLTMKRLTMNMSLTKKPMKPMTTNPRAVFEQILLNSVETKHFRTRVQFMFLKALFNFEEFERTFPIGFCATLHKSYTIL